MAFLLAPTWKDDIKSTGKLLDQYPSLQLLQPTDHTLCNSKSYFHSHFRTMGQILAMWKRLTEIQICNQAMQGLDYSCHDYLLFPLDLCLCLLSTTYFLTKMPSSFASDFARCKWWWLTPLLYISLWINSPCSCLCRWSSSLLLVVLLNQKVFFH